MIFCDMIRTTIRPPLVPHVSLCINRHVWVEEASKHNRNTVVRVRGHFLPASSHVVLQNNLNKDEIRRSREYE